MSRKQVIAIVTPVVLIGVLYPVLQLLARAFANDWRIGWHLAHTLGAVIMIA